VNDWTLLIDFGTSFSRVASLDAARRVELIEVDGTSPTSSGIWADSKSRLITGLTAQQQALLSPERWERAPGRRLGQPDSFRLGSVDVTAVTAVTKVLEHLSATAIARRGGAPSQVRLICPARWAAARREAMLQAARAAKLGSPSLAHDPLLVDEPLAAARVLADAGQFPPETTIGLLSMGGGSVEMSVIDSGADGFVVRAIGGLDGVGGETFDDLLYAKVIDKIVLDQDAAVGEKLRNPPDAQWRRIAENLFREVRRAKEELTTQTSVTLDAGAEIGRPVRLDRIELENVVRAQVLGSAREFGSTIERAGRRPATLHAVYLAGGSSRIPLVARAIYDVLGIQAKQLNETSFILGATQPAPESVIDLAALDRAARPGPSLLAAVLPLAIAEASTAGSRAGADPAAASATATKATAGSAVVAVSPAAAPIVKTLAVTPTSIQAGTAHGSTAAEQTKTAEQLKPSEQLKPNGPVKPASNGQLKTAASVAVKEPAAKESAVKETTAKDAAVAERAGGAEGSGPESAAAGPASAGSSAPPALPVTSAPSFLRRRRWPILLTSTAVVVLGVVALIGPASGHSGSASSNQSDALAPNRSATSSTGSTGTPSDSGTPVPSPSVGTALPAVSGLSAATHGISIMVSWHKVAGAATYVVYRDAATSAQTSRILTRTSFVDRPGDGAMHSYAVVAQDDGRNAGSISDAVQSSAKAPYGGLQSIASAWTAVIPQKPGQKGSAGQTCVGRPAASDFSTGKIVCTFPQGLQFQILRYATSTDRDHRFEELQAEKGVSSGRWDVPFHGKVHSTGQMLVAGPKLAHGPWRWWTYDTAPTFGMYADWPKHSAKQLGAWWRSRAPFRN
jgi:molecular chaperone DnaK